MRDVVLCVVLCAGCGAGELRSHAPTEAPPGEAPDEQAPPAGQASAEDPPLTGSETADPGELVARAFAMARELSGRVDIDAQRASYDAPPDWAPAVPGLGALFRGEADRVTVELTWGRGNISSEYDATWALLVRFGFRSHDVDEDVYRERLRAMGFEDREERRPGQREHTRYRHRSDPFELQVDEASFDGRVTHGQAAVFVWGHGLDVPFDRLGGETVAALARLPGAHTVRLERNAVPTRDYPEVAIDSFDRVVCVMGPERALLVARFDGLSTDSLFPSPSDAQVAYFRAPSATADGVVIKRNQACLFGGQRIACARPGCVPAR